MASLAFLGFDCPNVALCIYSIDHGNVCFRSWKAVSSVRVLIIRVPTQTKRLR